MIIAAICILAATLLLGAIGASGNPADLMAQAVTDLLLVGAILMLSRRSVGIMTRRMASTEVQMGKLSGAVHAAIARQAADLLPRDDVERRERRLLEQAGRERDQSLAQLRAELEADAARRVDEAYAQGRVDAMAGRTNGSPSHLKPVT